MTIRLVITAFGISLFLLVFAIFFTQQVSPFQRDRIQVLVEQEQIEEGDFEGLIRELQNITEQGLISDYLSSNAYVGIAIVLSAFFSFIFGMHVSIDKLFFKKFFEKPSLPLAVRRSTEITFLLGLYFLTIIFAFDILIVFAVGGIIIIAEIFTLQTQNQKEKEFPEQAS